MGVEEGVRCLFLRSPSTGPTDDDSWETRYFYSFNVLNNNTGLLTQWSTMFLHIPISGGGVR